MKSVASKLNRVCNNTEFDTECLTYKFTGSLLLLLIRPASSNPQVWKLDKEHVTAATLLVAADIVYVILFLKQICLFSILWNICVTTSHKLAICQQLLNTNQHVSCMMEHFG